MLTLNIFLAENSIFHYSINSFIFSLLSLKWQQLKEAHIAETKLETKKKRRTQHLHGFGSTFSPSIFFNRIFVLKVDKFQFLEQTRASVVYIGVSMLDGCLKPREDRTQRRRRRRRDKVKITRYHKTNTTKNRYMSSILRAEVRAVFVYLFLVRLGLCEWFVFGCRFFYGTITHSLVAHDRYCYSLQRHGKS